MSDDEDQRTPVKVEEGIKDMKIKNEDSSSDEEPLGTIRLREVEHQSGCDSAASSPTKMIVTTAAQPPKKPQSATRSPDKLKGEHEEVLGGDFTLKQEPGQPPKLTRMASQKVMVRTPPLFDHYKDKTQEATGVFQVITQCIYSAKYLGSTEHAMECDCTEEWDATTKINSACGDDSDCINRATKMECVGDCGCGADCQNQRFQRQQYANVAVIKTEKKGYGLRAEADLQPNDFIFEYIGEVINEGQFRRRMLHYDEEGIKHFYFMSLSKGEFVDATKKGNLGRFCNHSCNPNCYVDKWVVGDKLRMGIFAERKIKAGEELVFNYNVDRYGADPQPCYCGEPNCTGFIGGKTQTERATKLSHTTIEALGIDDGDGWDTAVAKKPRKKKAGEDDEEYINNLQPRSLDEEGVTKVMATLMQCKEKWIAVKLLGRIQSCSDEKVINRVVKMHGYQILNSALSTWKEDFNVVLQILDILNHFPRLTRNKISDSKIETTVASLEGCGDERVEAQAATMLKEWATLETGYRIPRMKRDPNSNAERHSHFERRESARDKPRSKSRSRSRSRSRSLDAPKGPAAPTGPRNNVPQRSAAYLGSRAPFRPPRPFNALPTGWFAAIDSDGKTYYYSTTAETTWTRPTKPAAQPPPPPKLSSTNKILDDIINEITNAKANTSGKVSASATPQVNSDESRRAKKDGKEKWRTYSEEKQKKLYENTLFPHIKYVTDRYKKKLSKDDIKSNAKEVRTTTKIEGPTNAHQLSKKLVNSDFKNHRVEDPTQISPRQEKQVKKFVREYFEKLVAKKNAHEKKKAERESRNEVALISPVHLKSCGVVKLEVGSDGDEVMEMSEDEDVKQESMSITPVTPEDQIPNGDGLKRKREADIDIKAEDDESGPSKRPRSITPPVPPPPPPPPPPTMGIPEGSDTTEDSVTFEDGSPQEYASYLLNGKMDDTLSTDASINLSAHPHGNGSFQATAQPPPPPNGSSNGEYKNGPLFQLLQTPNGSYEASTTTPVTPDDNTTDVDDEGMGSLVPDHSRYIAAQESM
ncbi:histone methyltransferase set2 [Lambiella insularis]|nr:histone methyltransferase set2 [Lambiella insularis]